MTIAANIGLVFIALMFIIVLIKTAGSVGKYRPPITGRQAGFMSFWALVYIAILGVALVAVNS